MGQDTSKFHFSIDRGGTFTDVYCRLPEHVRNKDKKKKKHVFAEEEREVVLKLLSVDPSNYDDAPTEGIRRILAQYDTKKRPPPDNNNKGNNNTTPTTIPPTVIKGKPSYPKGVPIDTTMIGSIRMGTTVATNALLERKGERVALLTTRGFQDLLRIGNQSRNDIFDLTCRADALLYEKVVEVDERVVLDAFYPDNNDDGDNNDDSTKVMEVVEGVTGEKVRIVKVPEKEAVMSKLEEIWEMGIRSLAIVFLHGYTYPHHERMVGEWASEMGFTQVSCSGTTMPMVRVVNRGHTTCASAYLTPCIQQYVSNFRKGFGSLQNVRLTFMKSDGGLADPDRFGGHQGVLSGPAGGVIGYAKTTPYLSLHGNDDESNHNNNTTSNISSNSQTKSYNGVIGFDMGGTSTDVSRYAGQWEHVMETTTAGVVLQAPQLDIHTVAAGGGSLLRYWGGRFLVGPDSAGAHPGPVCYRKGGKLAVTDANLILGRILPHHFPAIFGTTEDLPLDVEASRQAFEELLNEINGDGEVFTTVEELAYGFLQVANEAMGRPIRNLTEMKGYDISSHVLACFGGAGPQHACAMAQNLGMSRVYVHRHGGILSAYGLAMADAVQEEQEPAADVYEHDIHNLRHRTERLSSLAHKATEQLVNQGYPRNQIVVEHYLNLRYQGTDSTIMVQQPNAYNNDNMDANGLTNGLTNDDDDHSLLDFDGENSAFDYAKAFVDQYQREYGFCLTDRPILIDDYRVRAVVRGTTPTPPKPVPRRNRPPTNEYAPVYFHTGWQSVEVYAMEDCRPGHVIPGPAIIVQPTATVVLEIGCDALVTSDGNLDISIRPLYTTSNTTITNNNEEESKEANMDIPCDPVQLSIYAHRFMGIAEQMGRTLARTSISVNIRERLDFSCALFTPDGGLVANAPHIPVHLGAMQFAVKFQKEYWEQHGGLQEGDVLVSNHPLLAGGSHLPDITVMTPVFFNGTLIFFVASRGHHADIGGIAPGSMPPNSTTLQQEGATIVAFKLVQNGVFQEEGITQLLQAPAQLPHNFGTRNLSDNLSDLKAQVAANQAGIHHLLELVKDHSLNKVHAYMRHVQHNAEAAVRQMLKEFAIQYTNTSDTNPTPTVVLQGMDYMDDGTPIQLSVEIHRDTGDATFDFTGTGPQVLGNHNAPPAVTYSAVIYSLRSMLGKDIPLNQGCLAPITFVIPQGCLLNPSKEAAVVGGNVLTSQRIVDVVLRAFGACAASQGCMNNLTFGNDHFGYYETIAGGAGAGPTWDGRSGVHTHCTNTRITDPEILERRYPVQLHTFALRPGSGGTGHHPGGDGVIRELSSLSTDQPLTVSILSERRSTRPYGMHGGGDALPGRNLLKRSDGTVINIGSKCTTTLQLGDILRIETPGGGGYGAPPTTPN